MQKTAVIFGLTGQDGSYLSEFLLNKGYKVVGVTRRVSVDTLERIAHIKDKITIEESDISDPFSVGSLLVRYKPDEVYNLAAQSHVATSFTQPSLTWDITAKGVLNILEAIHINDLKCKFYQASSSEMFGKSFSTKYEHTNEVNFHEQILMSGFHDPINISFSQGKRTGIKYQDEDTPMLPQSPYAIAKLAAHHLVRLYRDSYGIFACSGILFNHESERRGEKFVTRKITKWLGEFKKWKDSNCIVYDLEEGNFYSISNESRFEKLKLGNLQARRDWGHAQDYVEGMWLMLQQEKPDDYILSTQETHSIEDFLALAFSSALPELSTNEKDWWRQYIQIDPSFYRPAEVDYLLGDSSKARKKLGWSPKVSFEQLVARMVESDIKNA